MGLFSRAGFHSRGNGKRVQATSKEAFADNAENFETMGDRIVAFLAAKKLTMTRSEIAQALNISTSTMSGRIRDLLDHGRIIEEPGRYQCKVTGRWVRGVSAA